MLIITRGEICYVKKQYVAIFYNRYISTKGYIKGYDLHFMITVPSDGLRPFTKKSCHNERKLFRVKRARGVHDILPSVFANE